MPDLATVLDDGYVPLGGAANSLARCARRLWGERSCVAQDGRGNEQATLRLHPMQCGQAADRANALPPDPAVRESLSDVIAIMRGEEPSYDILSRTPLSNYPERGRRELEAFMVRRSVLANFLRSRCQMLSLANIGGSHAPVCDVPAANENHSPIVRHEHLRGRPRKTAWPRMAELARQLAREHPDWQRKRLAFEVWTRARDELGDGQVPSVATIQRSMVEILEG